MRKVIIRRSERGYAMAFWTVFLSLVVVPLSVLTVDITRAMYVRTHLQSATDAACEAAAQALDVPAFNQTGEKRINLSIGSGYAMREFGSTVVDQGIVRYGPRITSIHLLSPTIVACSAAAKVDILIPAAPLLQVNVESVSETRVRKN